MGRIVVGVDDSATGREALRWAAKEAAQRSATLQAIMVWENPNRDMWVPSDPPGTDRLALFRAALDRAVRSVLGEAPAVDLEKIVVEGHPATVLIDAAKGAELLVVGNRGHGGFSGMLIGSVSLHCVSHATCPVVVIRGEAQAR